MSTMILCPRLKNISNFCSALGVPVQARLNLSHQNARSDAAFCAPERVTNVRLRDPETIATLINRQAERLVKRNANVINNYSFWAVTATHTSRNAAKIMKAGYAQGSLAGVTLNGGNIADINLGAVS